MGDLSTEMVVPRVNEENFGFAFNDFDFADRVLRLEIIPDESYHTRKKRKNDSGSCAGAKVVTLHITSAILAAKSPFFYKLFKNGMRESQHKIDVSLKINASEEASLMDLLKFVYENNLSATSVPDLINVLIAADKFEVTSCMRYSIQMLLMLPMSLENALLFLELPSSVMVSEIVQPLIDEAKKYIFTRFKDFTKSKEEAMKLPLFALEVVLGGSGLQVDSEDDVYDFLLKWARVSYSDPEERREILTKCLARFVCFPNMSSSKLKEVVLACREFDRVQILKLAMNAVFSKLERSCGQDISPSKDLATTTSRGFLGRVYRPHCVVYFDLTKDELKSLFTTKPLYSRPFGVGGKRLYLYAQCHKQEQDYHLGLYLKKLVVSETCTLDYEFAVMNKSSKEFQIKHKARNVTFQDHSWGSRNLLGISWTEFMSDDSEYFIDGILHLRAEITLVNNNNNS